MVSYKVIAIDGPAASGKSSVGCELAKELEYIHIDSGALYRSLTYCFMQEWGSGSNADEFGGYFTKALSKVSKEAQVPHAHSFANCGYNPKIQSEKQQNLYKNKDITKHLHDPQLTQRIRFIADNHNCRQWINQQLRNFLSQANLIVDGRDIGTIVFPETPFKFFLQASPRVRAQRRWEDFKKAGHSASLDELEAEIAKRDQSDAQRKFGGMKIASDAITIDTSQLNVAQVVTQITTYLPCE